MELKEVVKEKYGQAALRVNAGGSSCCGASTALDGFVYLYAHARRRSVLARLRIHASMAKSCGTSIELRPNDGVVGGSGGLTGAHVDFCSAASRGHDSGR